MDQQLRLIGVVDPKPSTPDLESPIIYVDTKDLVDENGEPTF